MERLINCDIVIDIELIELVSGGNQYFEVSFLTKDKQKYKMIFNFVWDIRCSIENASLTRFYELRKTWSDSLITNSVYMIENSEYIKYFEAQVTETRPIDELKHYIIYDEIDTVLDVLTPEAPKLIKI